MEVKICRILPSMEGEGQHIHAAHSETLPVPTDCKGAGL